MNGLVKFYDEPTGWGLIVGDDGALYMLRGGQLADAAPRVGERVAFEPQTGVGGLRAAAVRRLPSS
jgi:cold shock CspA family protein